MSQTGSSNSGISSTDLSTNSRNSNSRGFIDASKFAIIQYAVRKRDELLDNLRSNGRPAVLGKRCKIQSAVSHQFGISAPNVSKYFREWNFDPTAVDFDRSLWENHLLPTATNDSLQPSNASNVYDHISFNAAILPEVDLSQVFTQQSVETPSILANSTQSAGTPDLVYPTFPSYKPTVFRVPKTRREDFISKATSAINNLLTSIGTQSEERFTLEFLDVPTIYLPQKAHSQRSQHSQTNNNPPTLDSTIRRCSQLIKSGYLSKAMNVLQSFADGDVVAMTDSPEVLNQLRDLHPFAEPLNAERLGTPQLQFVVGDLMEALEHCQKGSKGAFSAWSFELIRIACSSDIFQSKAVQLINSFVNGSVGCRDIWCSARLLGIRKGTKLRPIAIADPWMRLIGRMVSQAVKPTLVELFSPIQFGFGIPSGCEIVAHICAMMSDCIAHTKNRRNNAAYNDLLTRLRMADPNATPTAENEVLVDYVILQVDQKNAFNSICRNALLSAVQTHVPQMETFFLWLYGTPSRLYSTTGNVICDSATGVRQGDSLGPALFCLGIHKTLRKLQDDFPGITIVAFMDDIFILGSKEQAQTAFVQLNEQLAHIALVVNQSKCRVYPEGPENLTVQVANDGIEVLGSPVGSLQFVRDKTSARFEGYLRTSNMIQFLSTTESILLLRQCINAKPQYALRTSDPALIQPVVKSFDDSVNSTLANLLSLADYPWGDIQTFIRHLPFSKGGLGMRTLSASHEPAFHVSRSKAISFLQSKLPNLHARLSPFQKIEPTPANHKHLRQEVDNGTFEKVTTLLAGTPHQLKLFKSFASPYISSWIAYPESYLSNLCLSPVEYAEAMRLRLLIPTSAARCTCGHEIGNSVLGQDPFHALNCSKSARYTKHRHDNVRDLLCTFIKHCQPLCRADKEVPLAADNIQGSQGNPVIIPDIIYRPNETGILYYIDVAMINPGASAYVDKDGQQIRHEAKMTKYRQALRPGNFEIIPFVLDITGKLSTKSNDFVNKICGFQPGQAGNPIHRKLRVQLLNNIARTSMKCNAAITKNGRFNNIVLPTT
jgi:hypothetical protein